LSDLNKVKDVYKEITCAYSDTNYHEFYFDAERGVLDVSVRSKKSFARGFNCVVKSEGPLKFHVKLAGKLRDWFELNFQSRALPVC
jgi:hypothetical protein